MSCNKEKGSQQENNTYQNIRVKSDFADLARKIIDAHLHCSDSADDLLISYAEFNGLRYNLEELLRANGRMGHRKGTIAQSTDEGWDTLAKREDFGVCAKSDQKLLPILTVEPSKDHRGAHPDSREDAQGFRQGLQNTARVRRSVCSATLSSTNYMTTHNRKIFQFCSTPETPRPRPEASNILTLSRSTNWQTSAKT